MTRIYRHPADRIGMRIHRFVVIGIAGTRKLRTYFRCKCDCGKEFEISSDKINKNKSCGCFRDLSKKKRISTNTIKLSVSEMHQVRKLFNNKIYPKEKLLTMFNLTPQEFDYILALKSVSFSKTIDKESRRR